MSLKDQIRQKLALGKDHQVYGTGSTENSF